MMHWTHGQTWRSEACMWSGEEEGRGWMSVEDVVRVKEHSLSNNFKKRQGQFRQGVGCLWTKRKTWIGYWTKEEEVGWIAWQTNTWAVSVMNWWERRKLLEIVTKTRSNTSDSGLQGYHLETTRFKKCRTFNKKEETVCIYSVNFQSWLRPTIKTPL